ncbi:MAG TPA: glycosyltransferase, partial [Actinotalea sp.]|nr:glycosyltransferase [Actinotalea sp.]
MRIAHLTNAYAPHSGGVRTFAHALGRGYQDRGHELVLVVPADRARRTRQDWGVLVTLPAPRVPGTAGYRAMVDSRTVRATLDSLEVDAIEVSDRFTLRHTGAWARAAGVPSLVLLHERLDGVLRALHVPAAAARAMADRHNRRTLAAFDHVVVTTRFAGRELERLGVEPEVVPLGVDLVRFPPLAAARAGEVPDDTVPWRTPARLVLCSRLSPEKRPDLAADPLGVLLARGTDAELLIGGAGPAR